EVRSVVRVPAGYGKVAAVERLEQELEIRPDRTIYIGDGSSDVHVMLHVNNRDGFTIAVSENKQIARIAGRTVLSDTAFSVLVPVFEQIVGWAPAAIRTLFESYGLSLHEWEKAHTDWVTVRERPGTSGAAVACGGDGRHRLARLGGNGCLRRVVCLSPPRNPSPRADGGSDDVDRL